MARLDPEDIGLHTIRPKPGATHARKRLGRGKGSGQGKTAGKGHKGANARAGAKDKRGYEGGQTAIHMRMRKLRGPHMKKSMPFEPFRTHTQPVNLSDLNLFEDGAEVTPETLREKGLATRKDVPVKILGDGDLGKKLTIRVHYASKSAREKIEGAGGTIELLVEPKKAKPRKEKPAPVAEAEPADDAPEPEEAPEPEAAEPEPASEEE